MNHVTTTAAAALVSSPTTAELQKSQIQLNHRLTLVKTTSTMQTAESVCLWNYQFKNNHNKNSPPSPLGSMASGKACPENAPYLACTERYACQNEMSSKATFYCVQCNSLQCVSCEKEIHNNPNSDQHERLNLEEIEDELCSMDRRHQAVFYCSTCALSFCYSCYENQHQHSDGRQHKPQKYREGQMLSATKKKNNNK